MEFLGDFGSFLSGVGALGTLLLGANWWGKRQRRADKNEKLVDAQLAVTNLQLRDEQDRALNKHRAEFTCRFSKKAKYTYQLHIANKGSTSARNVDIEFPEGCNFVIGGEVERYFPAPELKPQSSIRLLATTDLSNTATFEFFILSWLDDAGKHSEEFRVYF